MLTPIRILHLEDSQRDTELVQDKLAADGLECDIVRASEQASFKAALTNHTYDIILCDYNLPDYDGFSALKLARKTHPTTPVMIISGSLNEEEAVKCLHQGATDYLLKQRMERLPAAIKRALQEAEDHRKRLNLEQELQESEARFRQLAEHSSDVFWFCALHPERFIYISPAAEKIWGEPVCRFYEDPAAWLAAIHPNDQAGVVAARSACAQKQTPRYEMEYRVIRPDGSICWVLDSGTPICDGSGATIRLSGVARDKTERKKAEERTLRTQRIESIGTLASGIAHDLNNTLAPVVMGIALIRTSVPTSMTPILTTMEESAMRGSEMVRQLLTFGKGIDGEQLAVQPDYLLKEMQKLIRGTFPKDIALEVKFATPPQTVLGDPTQLHQVLLNLCINARDAMPEGGTLTLETAHLDADETFCSTLPEAKPGPYVILRVKDTGSGIPPEILNRIFEPFFSTKGPGKGTGLGLATVANIARSHNGFVQVHSKVGQGSTFSIGLPVATVTGEVKPPVAQAELPEPGHGETILVVDDDQSVRKSVSWLLERMNFKVLTAADGVEALVCAAEHRSVLRLVVTDLHMPHMNGVDVARALKRMLPQVPIMIVSGRMDDRHEKELTALGISARLDKPCTGHQLAAMLQQVLADTSKKHPTTG